MPSEAIAEEQEQARSRQRRRSRRHGGTLRASRPSQTLRDHATLRGQAIRRPRVGDRDRSTRNAQPRFAFAARPSLCEQRLRCFIAPSRVATARSKSRPKLDRLALALQPLAGARFTHCDPRLSGAPKLGRSGRVVCRQFALGDFWPSEAATTLSEGRSLPTCLARRTTPRPWTSRRSSRMARFTSMLARRSLRPCLLTRLRSHWMDCSRGNDDRVRGAKARGELIGQDLHHHARQHAATPATLHGPQRATADHPHHPAACRLRCAGATSSPC